MGCSSTQVQRLFYIDSRFRTLRGHFRQLRTALRLRSPGSLLLLLNRLHCGDVARFSPAFVQQAPITSSKLAKFIGNSPSSSNTVHESCTQFCSRPISKGLDGNWDGLCGRLLNITIRDVLHCPTEENISVILHPDLTL